MINNWKKTKIGDFVRLEYGKGLPEQKRIKGSIPVYGSNGIVGYHNESLIKGKGVIVGRKGTIGHVEWVDRDFWPIDTTYYIPESDKYDLLWLSYLLKSLNLKNLNRATGVPGLNRDDVYNLYISLPEKNTQEKIASILFSIDKAIRKIDLIIEKTEVLKQGLMQDLFSMRNKSWKIQKLGEITNFIDYRGKTPKKSASGIPLITAKNVRMGFIDPEPREFIRSEDYGSWMTRGIPNIGDVLFTTEAPLGNVAQLETNEKVAFAQRVIIIQPKSGLDSTFLKYLLMSKDFQGRIASLGTGGTVKGIKAKVLKQINIPIPPLGEQNKISSILSSIHSKIGKEKENKKLFLILKNGLMQDIFSQRVQII